MRSRGGWSFHIIRFSFPRPKFNNKYTHGSRDHQRHRRQHEHFITTTLNIWNLISPRILLLYRQYCRRLVGYTYFNHSTRQPVIILWRWHEAIVQKTISRVRYECACRANTYRHAVRTNWSNWRRRDRPDNNYLHAVNYCYIIILYRYRLHILTLLFINTHKRHNAICYKMYTKNIYINVFFFFLIPDL